MLLINRQRNRLLLRSGIFFIIAVAALLLSSYLLFKSQADNNLAITKSQEYDDVIHQQNLFRFTFEVIEADLKVLTGHNDFSHALNDPDRNADNHLAALSREIIHFARYKMIYDQIRILDLSGQEIIRVNSSENGIHLESAEKLQNKANRYYFQQTVKLKPDDIYISPLDLNIERGKVEEPYKPTIRFGLPLFDDNGNRLGVLVINYLASYLLNILSVHDINHEKEFWLLNSDGYWLKGPVAEDEWGFMFKNGQDKTFAGSFPDAWQKIKHNESGQFINDSGMFTFNTIYPLLKSSGYSPAPQHDHASQQDYRWTIISFVPTTELFASSQELKRLYIIINGILALFLALASALYVSLKLKSLQAGRELREKNALVHNIVNTAFDGIITIDAQGIITSFNASAAAMFGYSAREAIGKNVNMIVPYPHHEQHDNYIKKYIATREAHIINSPREVEGLHKAGHTFPIELCISGKKIESEWMFTGMVRDISERKAMLKNLETMAITDGLTKVFNRAFFTRQLEHEFNRARRYKLNLSLVLFDIDFFKAVNDEYGHPAGDAMLTAIARTAQQASRDIDFVTRYGGEEFAIILPETPQDSAMIYAERLKTAIAETEIIYEGQTIQCTASIGVVCLTDSNPDTPDHFIKMVDDALYKAKQTGRNNVTLWGFKPE